MTNSSRKTLRGLIFDEAGKKSTRQSDERLEVVAQCDGGSLSMTLKIGGGSTDVEVRWAEGQDNHPTMLLWGGPLSQLITEQSLCKYARASGNELRVCMWCRRGDHHQCVSPCACAAYNHQPERGNL